MRSTSGEWTAKGLAIMAKFITYSIYCITCIPTSQKYIGLTKSLKRRHQEHFDLLISGNHSNRLLQGAYTQHGRAAFLFEAIEKSIAPERIAQREKYWIAHYQSYGKGFNLT